MFHSLVPDVGKIQHINLDGFVFVIRVVSGQLDHVNIALQCIASVR